MKKVSMKAFPGAKATQFDHHTILLFEDNTYDTAAIQFGISYLLSSVKLTSKIYKYITDICLKCRNNSNWYDIHFKYSV